MATSKFTKKTAAVRRIVTDSKVGGASMRLQLNRDFLVSEHKIYFTASQPNTGTDPTSVDVRDFIDTVSLETSDGRRLFLTGAQAYDLARFTEQAGRVVNTLGATSTSAWSMEIHHSNSEALLDMLTALRSNEFTTLDLNITFASDAANGFKGGTAPGVCTYTATVESHDYEMLDNLQLGSFKHFAEKQELAGTAVGAQPDFQLMTGNSTRFLMLHAYDVSGAVPVLSDAIVGNLTLVINGREYRVTTGASVRQHNASHRGFDLTGVMCIDFGDDEVGFLNLSKVNQAKLQWDVLAGAPAWRVKLAQDYTVPR